jgi:hypothetical protein
VQARKTSANFQPLGPMSADRTPNRQLKTYDEQKAMARIID